MVFAHRFSWSIFVGEIPKGMCVCHKCDIRNCVNPDHLFIGSIYENNKDTLSKGRYAVGESNGRSKLTPEQVIEIRKKSANGSRRIDIANEFKIHETTLDAIIKRKNWRHI